MQKQQCRENFSENDKCARALAKIIKKWIKIKKING